MKVTALWLLTLLATLVAIQPGGAAAADNAGKPSLVWIMLSPDDGGWTAIQMADISNPGPGRLAKLEIPVPPVAAQIELSAGSDPAQIKFEHDQLIDQAGLGPGENRRIIITYRIPLGQVELLMRFPHGVETVIVAIPKAVNMVGSEWVADGFTQVGDRSYELYKFSSSLLLGETLKVVATREQSEGAPGPVGQAGVVPPDGKVIGQGHGGSMATILLNFGLIGTALALAIVGTGAVGRRKSPRDERHRLIDRIALLDLDFQDGRLTEQAYQSNRARLKDELIRLTLSQEATG